VSARKLRGQDAADFLWLTSVEARHLVNCFERDEKRKEGLRLIANCKKWAKRLGVDARRLAYD